MAAIEVLIYNDRGIGRERVTLLSHGNDSMVVLRGFRSESVLVSCC